MNLEPTRHEIDLGACQRLAQAIFRIASRHHNVADVDVRRIESRRWTPEGARQEQWYSAYIVRRVRHDGDLDCFASAQCPTAHAAAVDCLTRMYSRMGNFVVMDRIIDAIESELHDGSDCKHVAKIHRELRDDKLDQAGDELELNERGDKYQAA